MAGRPDSGGDDRQPEALETFEAAARAGGKKPDDIGTHATPETAPRPDDPGRKAATATRVLDAGVDKNPEEATRAVQESRDPRIP
jgi:hypothetical protein